MGKALELTNLKFGKLLVQEKTDKRTSSGAIIWKCLCDCGNIVEVPGPYLKNNHTTSCGCYASGEEIKEIRKKKKKDITNQRFGKLIAQYPIPCEKNIKTKWHCICDCGNECDVVISQLTSGKTKSCGCLRNIQKPIKDIQNQRFGKLVALYPTEKRINKGVVWKCKCDCGNNCEVNRSHLINGYVSSCGCLTISKGELKIENLLNELNYQFEKQKTFNDCRFLDTNHLAYFDFYVNDQFIIEYDGEQHFIHKEFFGDINEFHDRQKKDQFKNEWAKLHHIPILRISYKEYNLLNKDYLMERIIKCLNIADIQ